MWLLKCSQLQLAPQCGGFVPLPSSPSLHLQQMFMGVLLVNTLLLLLLYQLNTVPLSLF